MEAEVFSDGSPNRNCVAQSGREMSMAMASRLVTQYESRESHVDAKASFAHLWLSERDKPWRQKALEEQDEDERNFRVVLADSRLKSQAQQVCIGLKRHFGMNIDWSAFRQVLSSAAQVSDASLLPGKRHALLIDQTVNSVVNLSALPDDAAKIKLLHEIAEATKQFNLARLVEALQVRTGRGESGF